MSSDNIQIIRLDENNLPLETFDLFKLPRKAAQEFKEQLEILINRNYKEKEYNFFKDKVGEIVTGIFIKVTPTDLVISIYGIYKAIIPNKYKVYRERFQHGDKVQVLIREVNFNENGPQVILDRKSELFVSALMTNYINEIKNNIVTIKKIYRVPGKISKIFIESDPANDAIGACIGVNGKKLEPIKTELQHEILDIIRWYDNPYHFIKSYLKKIPILDIQEYDTVFKVVIADSMVQNAINANIFNNVKILDECLKKEVIFYSLTDFNEEQNSKIQEEVDEICKFGDANPKEIFELLLQYSNVELIPLNKISEVNQETIKKYIDYLRDIELAHFIELGGTRELFKIVKELPSDIYFELLNYDICSIDDIKRYENAFELSRDTNIDTDACVLIMNAVNNL